MREIDMNQGLDELMNLALSIADDEIGNRLICVSCQGDKQIEHFEMRARPDGEQASYMEDCHLCLGCGTIDPFDENIAPYIIIGLLYALSQNKPASKMGADDMYDVFNTTKGTK